MFKSFNISRVGYRAVACVSRKYLLHINLAGRNMSDTDDREPTKIPRTDKPEFPNVKIVTKESDSENHETVSVQEKVPSFDNGDHSGVRPKKPSTNGGEVSVGGTRTDKSDTARREPDVPFEIRGWAKTMKFDEDAMQAEVAEKRTEYLSRDVEKKRKNYSCGKHYVTLDDVQTWADFAAKMPDSQVEKILQKNSRKIPAEEGNYEVNEKLNGKISLWRGDITKLEIDSIVNAANSRLLGGGGVDGAIHKAAGPLLVRENYFLRWCETGEVKISCGYNLPTKFVISTVGPQGVFPNQLKSCYERTLELLVKNQLRSTAFPCISTGIYGYPNDQAALVAIKTVRKFLEEHADKVDLDLYEQFLTHFFPLGNRQPVGADGDN